MTDQTTAEAVARLIGVTEDAEHDNWPEIHVLTADLRLLLARLTALEADAATLSDDNVVRYVGEGVWTISRPSDGACARANEFDMRRLIRDDLDRHLYADAAKLCAALDTAMREGVGHG